MWVSDTDTVLPGVGIEYWHSTDMYLDDSATIHAESIYLEAFKMPRNLLRQLDGRAEQHCSDGGSIPPLKAQSLGHAHATITEIEAIVTINRDTVYIIIHGVLGDSIY